MLLATLSLEMLKALWRRKTTTRKWEEKFSLAMVFDLQFRRKIDSTSKAWLITQQNPSPIILDMMQIKSFLLKFWIIFPSSKICPRQWKIFLCRNPRTQEFLKMTTLKDWRYMFMCTCTIVYMVIASFILIWFVVLETGKVLMWTLGFLNMRKK